MQRITKTNAESKMRQQDTRHVSNQKANDVAVEVPAMSATEFSEWLDQSLSQLVDGHSNYITRNSIRRFFSRNS